MALTKDATVPFSVDELALIQQLARDVWSEVGYDVLQAIADEKGKSIERVTISRRDVIEIALDAGRVEERLTRRAAGDLCARFAAASYEQLKRIVRPAFTYARYGL